MPPTLRLTTSFDLLLIAIMYMFMCLHKYRHCLLSQSVYVVCVYIVSEYQTLTKKAGPYSKWRPSQKKPQGDPTAEIHELWIGSKRYFYIRSPASNAQGTLQKKAQKDCKK